nr:hypothetical protein [Tanacetum cinerariifolium]
MFVFDDYLSSGSDESLPPSPIYDRYQSGNRYHVVPPPYTGTFMPLKPDLVFNNAPNDVVTDHHAFNVKLSPTKPDKDLSHSNRPLAPIIEDWVSGSEDESKTKALQNVPSFVQPTEQLVPINVVRPVSTVVPKIKVTRPSHVKLVVTKTNLPPRRLINHSLSPKASNSPPRVTAVKAQMVNTAMNMSYLSDFEELNSGYVSFGGNAKGGKVSGKGKFDGKVDAEFLVGYSVSSKAFRVFNSRTRIVQETLHVNFLENKPNVAGSGPSWLFNTDNLTKTMNNQPVAASNQSNPSNTNGDAAFDGKEPDFNEKKSESEFIVSPSSSAQSKKHDDKTKKEAKGKSPVDVVGPSNTAASPTHRKSSSIDTSQLPDDPNMPELEDISYSDDQDDVGVEADFNNLETYITDSPIRTTRVHKDHLVTQIIGFMVYQIDVKSAFLYETIGEEVHVCQPLGFEDPDYPDKKKDRIFISQDKYVAEILRKFGLTDRKSASPPIDTEKPLLKDPDGEDVIYLTLSRPDIMFAVCACARFQVTPKASHLHAIDLLAMKEANSVATSSTETGYVATASCCAQVLTMQVVQSGMESLKRMLHVTNILSAGSLTSQQMVLNSPCLTHTKNWLVQIKWSLFWTTIVVKKVNDVRRLQALLDKKKVVVTKSLIRDALCLDDAEGVECLPNEEIFAELARMGYEKPSTKLTFYKEFFLIQWKFLIHTILQCMSAKRTSWNEFNSSMASTVICISSGRKFNFSKYIFESLVKNVDSPTKFYMYPCFLQLMIRKQVGDLSTHTTKYTSSALTQKVGKGDADEVHGEDVNAADVVTKGVVRAVDDDAGISMDLLQSLMETCTTLTRRVEHLKYDKVAQALEISKLKSRVKKLERRNTASKLKRLKKVRSAQRIDTSDDTIMDDVSKHEGIIENIDADEDVVLEDAKDVAADAKDGQDADEEESKPTELQEVVDIVTTTKIITEVVTAASTTITADDVPIHVATIAAALILITAPSRRTKGVVIRDPREDTTTSTIIHSEAKSKDKGKGILRNQKEDKSVKLYQALKRKPQTEARARKNMMVYLKNVVGFKMDYFKGMSYDDIRPIFEKHFDSNVAFLQKIKEQMDEEDSKALKRLNESKEEKVAKKQKLDEEVEELKRHLQIVPNDEDDVYT